MVNIFISTQRHKDAESNISHFLNFSFSHFLNFSFSQFLNFSKKESFIRHTDIDAGLIVIDVL